MVAMVTMNDREAKEEIKVLIIVCGEYGHVMSWCFCSVESAKVYQQLNYMLKKLVIGAFNALRLATNTTCWWLKMIFMLSTSYWKDLGKATIILVV